MRGRACARAVKLALRVLDANAVLREPVPVPKARRRAHAGASVPERRAFRRAAGDGEPLRYAGASGAGRALSLGPCVLPREVLRLLRHPAVPCVLRALAARDAHGLSDVAWHCHLRLRLRGRAYVPAFGGVPPLVPAHVNRGARGARRDAVRRGRRHYPRAHAVDVLHARGDVACARFVGPGAVGFGHLARLYRAGEDRARCAAYRAHHGLPPADGAFRSVRPRPFLAVFARLEGRSRGQAGCHGCLQGGDGTVCAGRCRGVGLQRRAIRLAVRLWRELQPHDERHDPPRIPPRPYSVRALRIPLPTARVR